jgi:hypothetical protein
MSLEAVLIMAAVVIVLIVGWLAVVFRAASQPVNRSAHPGGQGAAGAAGQQADPRSADASPAQHAGTAPAGHPGA